MISLQAPYARAAHEVGASGRVGAMLGTARLLLLAHAVSVLSESVPAPSEPPGCTHLIVTTVTVADASEVSWVIDLHQAGSQTISSDPFASYDTVQKEICVEAGTHSITLVDSFGDGWITYSGDQSTVQIDYRGGYGPRPGRRRCTSPRCR